MNLVCHRYLHFYGAFPRSYVIYRPGFCKTSSNDRHFFKLFISLTVIVLSTMSCQVLILRSKIQWHFVISFISVTILSVSCHLSIFSESFIFCRSHRIWQPVTANCQIVWGLSYHSRIFKPFRHFSFLCCLSFALCYFSIFLDLFLSLSLSPNRAA